MRSRAAVIAVLTLTVAAPARAEKLSPAFKAAFEQVFRAKHTFAVVVREGIPTTSVYGVDGKSSSTAHFSIDVQDGRWKQAEGILDFDQTAADFLNRGEVMELASIAYKENRVDLRMVSVEAHKVTRGSLFKTTNREPVATNFKFFFPFAAWSEKDAPRAVEYIESYLKPFPAEDAAREWAVGFLSGQATASGSSRSGSTRASAPATRKEIKVGMTPLEVLDILGKPDKEVSFESKSRWTYPDLTVIFENGRVKEVRF